MSSLYNFMRENHILVLIETANANRISWLNLSNYEISRVPTPLLSCKHLTKLYLNNNYLEILPDEISNWESLKFLSLDYNYLTTVPASIGKLQHLVCLNLSHNKLGHLIPEIGLLTRLEVLWLNHTHLESIPPEIGNCTELDTFGARGNFIKELPPSMGKLHRMRWLTLEGNLLSQLPEEISGAYQLIHLNLSNNRFETVPKLDKLQDLQYVFLSQNIIKELESTYMEKLSFIKKIDLKDNPISNSFPLRHLKNLKFDEIFTAVNNQDQEESDSEDWEESIPSSELDISDSSDEEMNFEILATTLPKVAKFTIAGY